MALSRFQLYRLLRKNTKLSEKRNPMFEANQYGKLFGYIMVGFVAIELIALGTFFGWLAASDDIPEVIFVIAPTLMLFDFGARFMTQQTPMMLVKPYLLTPISKYTAIECFLISQILDWGNLIWMTIFLPYAFIVWCGGLSLGVTLGMLIMLHLIVVINSQWYLLVRTLVNQNLLWWLLPAAVYGLCFLPVFLLPDSITDPLIDVFGDFMEQYAFSWWTFCLLMVVAFAFFMLNRHLQMHLIYDEIGKKEKTKLKHVSEFSALNRFGQIGEYLKLEIKSTMRNKAIRSRFIQGVCFITFFSLAISFLDIYNSAFERNFFCLYAFLFFGSVNLTKVMCPEGNYIDLLMVHKENILTLLRAKYYYYCAVLVLPLIIMSIPVITGKFSLLMLTAYLFTATGPIYCLLFQMAVYNKTTLPLNDKITGKNQMENKWQAIVSMIAMFVPVFLVLLLQSIFDTNTAYWILTIIGLLLTLTEPYWMRNIYQRMMTRRYQNLEGFHTTR
mgnify:CR=1 FL=1